MAGALNQLNIGYNPLEDRLLLRVTTKAGEELSEYRVWLTRRFVRVIWNVLGQVLEKEATTDSRIAPESRQAVMQFQQEAALQRTNFSTPYAAKDAVTPLGPTPILASKIQVRKAPDGKKVLSMHAQDGQGINLGLHPQLIHSIRKLLVDATQKAEWNLDFSLLPPDEMPAETPEVSHKIN